MERSLPCQRENESKDIFKPVVPEQICIAFICLKGTGEEEGGAVTRLALLYPRRSSSPVIAWLSYLIASPPAIIGAAAAPVSLIAKAATSSFVYLRVCDDDNERQLQTLQTSIDRHLDKALTLYTPSSLSPNLYKTPSALSAAQTLPWIGAPASRPWTSSGRLRAPPTSLLPSTS